MSPANPETPRQKHAYVLFRLLVNFLPITHLILRNRTLKSPASSAGEEDPSGCLLAIKSETIDPVLFSGASPLSPTPLINALCLDTKNGIKNPGLSSRKGKHLIRLSSPIHVSSEDEAHASGAVPLRSVNTHSK